ncbi:hypothetical protein NF865_07515 [Thermococcus aggregans]|uniref:Uncharacterized protein n=1 Tax=Thermococcus aggregans TaxID=110163 RepID=A0A9E7MWP5_THEAG|nr:hypothetical protein [Thermococcus aggregans]USS40174.1 hypothetical protein NF865_07515 [Thermococcus aggregans]
MRKEKLMLFLSVLVFGGILWFFRPWFHGIIMGFYRNPTIIYLFIALAGVLIYSSKRKLAGNYTKRNAWLGVLFTVVILSLIVISIFTGALSNTALYKEYHPTQVSSELDLSSSKIRILPKLTAYRYAVDTIEYARYTLGWSHLTIRDGTPVWGFFIVPDGAWNAIRLKDKGVLFVDMNTTEARMERIENELQVGPGMQIFDNLEWNLYKKHYLIDLDVPRALYYEGKIYIVVPYTSYSFRVFYTVPKWGGVLIVDEEGNIEDLTPQEAINDERLKDFPIFPELLTRKIVHAQNYWKESVFSNIKNLWLHHENQIELIDVSEQGNRQPFLVIANDGKEYWMVAVEPYGRAHGLAAIYLINAQNGEMSQVKFETPLTGPVKAIDYVKKALPMFDWSQFMAVEPIPIFLNGELWWRVAIIPRSGSGIAKIAFVNAETKEVQIFEDEDEVRTFLLYGQVGAKVKEVSGVIEGIYSYIKNGNTHWILIIDNETLYLSTDQLSDELILKVLSLKEGDNVTVKISEGRLVEIEKG